MSRRKKRKRERKREREKIIILRSVRSLYLMSWLSRLTFESIEWWGDGRERRVDVSSTWLDFDSCSSRAYPLFPPPPPHLLPTSPPTSYHSDSRSKWALFRSKPKRVALAGSLGLGQLGDHSSSPSFLPLSRRWFKPGRDSKVEYINPRFQFRTFSPSLHFSSYLLISSLQHHLLHQVILFNHRLQLSLLFSPPSNFSRPA